MTKFSKGTAKLSLVGRRNWRFEAEPLPRPLGKTFESVLEDERLKAYLRRAVKREFAPQNLIDSIQSAIRQ